MPTNADVRGACLGSRPSRLLETTPTSWWGITIRELGRRVLAAAAAAPGPCKSGYAALLCPDAILHTYPDAGHGSLFQWHEFFQHHVTQFLASNSPFAPY